MVVRSERSRVGSARIGPRRSAYRARLDPNRASRPHSPPAPPPPPRPRTKALLCDRRSGPARRLSSRSIRLSAESICRWGLRGRGLEGDRHRPRRADWRKRVGVEPTRHVVRISPDLKSGRPTGVRSSSFLRFRSRARFRRAFAVVVVVAAAVAAVAAAAAGRPFISACRSCAR